MKPGDPFTGRGGKEYTQACDVEISDIGLAHAQAWVPTDEPVAAEPEVTEEPKVETQET